jgi:transposase-like protein
MVTHHSSTLEPVLDFPNLTAKLAAETGTSGENATVYWQGYIKTNAAGSYYFRLQSGLADQYFGANIAGTGFGGMGSTEHDVTIPNLNANTWYTIHIGMRTNNNAGTAMRLTWKPPFETEALIPAANLNPSWGPEERIRIPSAPAKIGYSVAGTASRFSFTNMTSVSLWVKTAQSTGHILHLYDPTRPEHEISLRLNGGYPEFFISRSTNPNYQDTVTATAPNRIDQDGQWHHIASVSDGLGVLKLYVDGALAGAVDTGFWTKSPRPVQPIYIGSKAGTSDFFNGQIDDISIYGDGLSPSSIANIYATKSAPSYDRIVHIDFEEGTGTTLTDNTPAHNNGTLHNTDNSDWVPGYVGSSAIELNGVDEYATITEGVQDHIIEFDLPAFNILNDETYLIWSYFRDPDLTVTNLTSAVTENVTGTQLSDIAGTRVQLAYAKLPSTLIPPAGPTTLKLLIKNSEKRRDGGITLIVPHIDPSKPERQMELFLDGMSFSNMASKVYSFALSGVTELEPLIILQGGESKQNVLGGNTALGHQYRPNYLYMLTGNGTPPAPYDDLKKLSGTRLLPVQDGTPSPTGPTDRWYPYYGREGRQLDVLSPNYKQNLWTQAADSGAGTISQQSASGKDWVAFQIFSSNFDEDTVLGTAESMRPSLIGVIVNEQGGAGGSNPTIITPGSAHSLKIGRAHV